MQLLVSTGGETFSSGMQPPGKAHTPVNNPTVTTWAFENTKGMKALEGLIGTRKVISGKWDNRVKGVCEYDQTHYKHV